MAVTALDKRETMSEEDLVSKSLSHECTLMANGGENGHAPMAGSLMQSAYSEVSASVRESYSVRRNIDEARQAQGRGQFSNCLLRL